MFGLNLKARTGKTIACCLSERGYSLAAVKDNKKLIFNLSREFASKPELMRKTFADDVAQLHIVGAQCRVILAPGQYQLLLMDALDVPEEEMVKALRWRLKGLVDYPLNDIAMDAFIVPPHGVVGQRRKVFVAVTLLSALKTKLAMLEAAYLTVSSIGIGELALANLLALMPKKPEAPLIVISLEQSLCQLQIIYSDKLYLVRQLPFNQSLIKEVGVMGEGVLLEIQRSIDYCLSELKLPEPQQIVFTPGFHEATDLLAFLRQELTKEIILLDIGNFLQMEPRLTLKEEQDSFYSIGGALTFSAQEQDE